MKIGFDGRELLRDHVTGIGRFLSNFLQCALKIKPSWEFILFGNQHTCFQFEGSNLQKIIIPEKSTALWDQVKLPRYLKREKADLFFSPYYKAPVFSACSTIITIHDVIPFIKFENMEDNPDGINHSGSKYVFSPVAKSWTRLLAERAAKIITVSNHSKKNIVEFFGMPEEKVEVVYEGVGEAFTPAKNDEIEKTKARYGIQGRYIFYVGNFEPHKNVQGILKAYSRMNRKLRKNYKLVIGGKKDCHFEIMKGLCLKLGLGEHTVFPGFIDNDHLPAIYSGADVFLFPSFYEGFGLPPLEAMACGTAVISSNRACIPEILRDAAILVDPGNVDALAGGIETVITHPNLMGALEEKGMRRAREFSLQKMSRKMLDIFETAGA